MFTESAIVGLWRSESEHGEFLAAFFADHIYAGPTSFRSELYFRGRWSLKGTFLCYEDVCFPEFPAMMEPRSWQTGVRELIEHRMITEDAGDATTVWERLTGEPDIDPAVDTYTQIRWSVMHHPSERAPQA